MRRLIRVLRILLKILLTKRGLMWMSVCGLGFVIFNIAAVELSSQSWFCNSCHIMNSYYDSWASSKHGDIKCIECHIQPGVDNFMMAKINGLGQVVDDLLNRTSTKPSADVSEFSCTRSDCHDVNNLEVLPEKHDSSSKIVEVNYEEPAVRKRFLFDHDKHLGLHYAGIKVSCTTCHSHVKGNRHFEVNTNTCISCHLIETDAKLLDNPTLIADKEAVFKGNHGSNGVGIEVNHVVTGITTGAGTEGGSSSSKKAIIRYFNVRTPRTTGLHENDKLLEAEIGDAYVEGEDEGVAGDSALNGDKEVSPPYRCNICHEPPKGKIEFEGLQVDHSEYLGYGAACESCHRDVTVTPDPVEDSQCLECHDYGMEEFTTYKEMHEVHTHGEHKVECFSCHGVTQHGPVAQTMQLNEFECQNCHRNQHSIQRATYKFAGKDLKDEETGKSAVSPMLLVHVDCTGCHISARALNAKPGSGATVTAAAAEACDKCHKPGLGNEMIPLWQNTTHSLYNDAMALMPGGDQIIEDSELQQMIAEAHKLLDLVRIDGSWGVHNPKYTEFLLDQARIILTDVQYILHPPVEDEQEADVTESGTDTGSVTEEDTNTKIDDDTEG